MPELPCPVNNRSCHLGNYLWLLRPPAHEGTVDCQSQHTNGCHRMRLGGDPNGRRCDEFALELTLHIHKHEERETLHLTTANTVLHLNAPWYSSDRSGQANQLCLPNTLHQSPRSQEDERIRHWCRWHTFASLIPHDGRTVSAFSVEDAADMPSNEWPL